jgi:predicted KAP-like P-loop ATPase
VDAIGGNVKVLADNPIQKPEDDVLGRSSAAKVFVNQIFSLDASEGLVVGVLGPWGSGKTSFVNLARLDLAEANVTLLAFNPWMFSGSDQLVESFSSSLLPS